MPKFFSLLVVLFLSCLAFSVSAHADTITLTNGQVYQGSVAAEEGDRVQIKLEGSGVRLWFSRDQIDSIEKPEPEEEELEEDDTSIDSLDYDSSDDAKRAQKLLEEMRKKSKTFVPRERKKKEKKAKPVEKPEVSESAPEVDQEEFDRLVKIMMDGPKGIKRINACKRLAEIGGEKAIPHLIQALDAKTPSMRKTAIRGLKKITGTDMRYDPMAPRAVRLDFIKDWKDWWEEKQNKEGISTLKSMF